MRGERGERGEGREVRSIGRRGRCMSGVWMRGSLTRGKGSGEENADEREIRKKCLRGDKKE